MPGRSPPRYVPTLTEVVRPVVAPARGPIAPTVATAARAGTAGTPGTAGTTAGALSEEQLVHRILQRIDLTLERKLREAIAAVVLEHTRALGPSLRQEIELVVQQAVSQALSEELTTPEPQPSSPP